MGRAGGAHGRRGVWPAGWRRKSQPAPVSCLPRCQFCSASRVLLSSNLLRATSSVAQPDCHPRARPEGPWRRRRGVAAMDARVKPGHDRRDGVAARIVGGAHGRRRGAVSRSRHLSLVSSVVSSAPRRRFCCHQICSAPPALSPQPDCHPRARPEGPWWRQRGVATMDARVKPGHDRWDGAAVRMAGRWQGRLMPGQARGRRTGAC